ncbi:MAG: PAS domain S-box protein, partial [Spirochaetia bacterium]
MKQLTKEEAAEAFYCLLNNSNDVIYKMDIPSRKYIYISPSVEKMTGYSADRFLNEPFFIKDIIHPDFKSFLKTQWDNLLAGSIANAFKYKLVRSDGRSIWVHQKNIIEKDNIGNPIAINGIVTDITEQKQVKEELQESKAQYQRLVDMLPVGILVHKDETCVFANEKCKNLLKVRSAQELIGRSIWDFIHPDYTEIVKNILKTSSQWEAGQITLEEVLIDSYGKPFNAEIHASLITFQQEEAILAVFLDISEEKAARQELETLLDEKQTLIRELYHRTKNTIQLIRSLIDIELKDVSVPEVQNRIDKTKMRINALSLMYEKLYNSSHIGTIDTAEYIENFIPQFINFHKSEKYKVNFQFDLEPVLLQIEEAIAFGLVFYELVFEVMTIIE